MGRIGILRSLLLASSIGVTGGVANAGPFTINDALRMAVQTNPIIGEAAANRRATEAELRQTQSTLLPQVRLEAQAGPERLNNPAASDPWQHHPDAEQWSVGCRREGLNFRSAVVVRWLYVAA